jgi:hypothetical protein
MGWGSSPTPNLQRGRPVYPFVWTIAFGLLGPTSSYTNASISLRIIWTTQDPLLRPSWDIKRGGGASSRQKRWTRYKISEEANNDQTHVYAYFIIESVLKVLNIPTPANTSCVKERIK